MLPIQKQKIYSSFEQIKNEISNIINITQMKKIIVLVVSSISTEREQVCRIIKSANHTPIEVDNGRTALKLLKARRPSVMVTDILTESLPCKKLIKEKQRIRSIRDIPVIILSDAAHLTIARSIQSPDIHTVLVKNITKEELLSSVQQSVSPAKKSGFSTTKTNRSDSSLKVKNTQLNRSLITKKVKCPFHKQDEPFLYNRLKSRTQRVQNNIFGIPCYTGPVENRTYCNFNHFDISVCPDCLFASNLRSDFIFLEKDNMEKASFTPATKRDFVQLAHTRESILGEDKQDAVQFDRTPVIAAKVAVTAAQSQLTLYKLDSSLFHNRKTLAFSYYLKAAQIAFESQLDTKTYLRRAHEIGSNFQPISEKVGVIHRHYCQMLALCIYLKDTQGAENYYKHLTESGNSTPSEQVIWDDYRSKAQELWKQKNSLDSFYL